MNVPNYSIKSVLYKGNITVTYQAERFEDKIPVIIKTNLSEYPSQQELANLKHEYGVLKDLSYPGVISAHDLIKVQNRFFLILEDIQGMTLKDWMGHKPVKLSDFFEVASQLATVLANVHSRNIIHKDIKPENILIDPATLKIKIIDFSLSSQLSFETSSQANPNVLEGTLSYISPEQTGRMNRIVDQRSDFYSLGVTFYEMLTGRLPFEGTDPLEIVYGHLAKIPEQVHEINPKVPKILSQLIDKLMAKSADDRYGSGFGLKEDLQICWNLWKDGKTSEVFPLGQKEIKNRLVISQKLYGREDEIKQLLNIFDRVCEEGTGELTLVSGAPGIGKSAFIQEIYKPLSREKGYFIRGKFDLLQRNTSYFAFIQAFKELMSFILTESENYLENLKQDILEAVGPNGQVVIKLIPELEQVIGKQPDVPELLPKESQNRFNFVFQKFIKVFAKKEHPLVMFIDDLQWADQASLTLLEHLLYETHHILIVGAYRDNEVSGHHPLLLTIESLETEKVPVTNIKLDALKEYDVDALLENTLGQNNIGELSSLIYSKTRGNPFFIIEFLKTIYQEELLTISDEGVWEWNAPAIRDKAISANVVDLLISKIKKLPEETQKILSLCACLGGKFDLNSIAVVSEKSLSHVAKLLWPAVQAELILTIGSAYKQASMLEESDGSSTEIEYKFLHDRVQEAAYQLISVPERKIVHLKIGRLLLERGVESNKQLFEVLGHLNYSVDLIDDQREKEHLIELNAKAGALAKDSSAYSSALTYFDVAKSLLPENSWQNNYEFTFKTNKNYAESLYLVGRTDEAETYLKKLVDKAHTVLDKVGIYNILVVQLTNIGLYAEAVQTGLEGLKLLGIKVPKPTIANLLIAFIGLKLRMTFTSARKKLDNLPPMTDPHYLAITKLMYLLGPPSFIYRPELHIILGFKIVHISIDHGYTQGTVLGFLSYMLLTIAKLNDYKEGDYWAGLMEKYGEKAGHIDNYTYFNLAAFYDHWNMPYKDTFANFKRSIKACIEEGDLNYLKYNAAAMLSNYHNMGTHLSDVRRSSEEAMQLFKNDYGFYDVFLLMHYLTDCLLTGKPLDENIINEHLKVILGNPFGKTSYVISFAKLAEAYYLMEDYPKSLEYGAKSMEYADSALGFSSTIDMEFLYGLSLAACLPHQTGWKKFVSWIKLRVIQWKFKVYGKKCPENHWHKYLFLTAEIAALKNDYLKAIDYYDKTIDQARDNEVNHHAGMACERAAKFYERFGKEKLYKIFLQEAYYYYTQWGCLLKTNAMEEQYSAWLKVPGKEGSISLSHSTSTSSSTIGGGFNLDFLSILKANRAISSEIVLDQLLKKIMKILMENAGGQRGVLLLEKEGHLWVEAEGFIDQEEVQLPEQLSEERTDLPLSVFTYVLRTSEPVILNSSSYGQFINDPYIVENQPKSLICSPIIQKNRVMGMLYLENNATEGSFTKERVELLSFLSAQASISLENARLYQASGKFVPVQFIDQLGKRNLVEIRLGDQVQQSMSVLFCDIRNFTTISEGLSAADTFTFINEFLGYMEPSIEENGGFIDKYIGDAIMALFKNETFKSVDAAIGMLSAMDRFNKETNRSIAIGIGINTGEIILGILGGKKHIAGTVIGDSVNIASRIEGLTKIYGAPLLLGGKTKSDLPEGSFKLRLIDEVLVKGKSIPVEIWEVCDVDPEAVAELKMETLDLFNQARANFTAQAFAEALTGFQECVNKNPDDKPAKFYIAKCEEKLKSL